MPLSTPTTDRPAGGTAARRRRLVTPVVGGILVVLIAAAGVVWWRGSVAGIAVREHCTATVDATTVELDPDQAGNAAIIAAVAARRSLPARAASIGIATAMQESKLTNVGYGDRDSLGLFQQRPSQGWGTARQVMDPVYAANAFYNALVKIDGYQTMPITEVAQRVQRSAFPSAYAQHEPEARTMASALSGYPPAGFSCVLRPKAVAAQRRGAGGLTLRAATLASRARAETGRSAADAQPAPGASTTPASADGTEVRFVVPGAEAQRRGWSLAHWAVARASALDVVFVATDGRQWRRDSSAQGWTAQPSGAQVPAGTVVVRVAAGG